MKILSITADYPLSENFVISCKDNKNVAYTIHFYKKLLFMCNNCFLTRVETFHFEAPSQTNFLLFQKYYVPCP